MPDEMSGIIMGGGEQLVGSVRRTRMSLKDSNGRGSLIVLSARGGPKGEGNMSRCHHVPSTSTYESGGENT